MSTHAELERTQFRSPVDLCAERYKGLETRLENVEKAVKDPHSEMRRMHDENVKTQSTNKIMLGAPATVVAGIHQQLSS